MESESSPVNKEEKAADAASKEEVASGATGRVRSLTLGVISSMLLGALGIIGLMALEIIRLGTRYVKGLVATNGWLKSALLGAIEGFGITYKVTHLCLSVLATIGLLAALFAIIARVFKNVPGLDKIYEEVAKKWSELLPSKEEGKTDMARVGAMLIGASIVSVSLLMVSISVKEWVSVEQQADQRWAAVSSSLNEINVSLGEIKGILTAKNPPPVIQAPTGNEISLRAQRSGIVKTVWDLKGKDVEQGQQLVELDCEDLHKEELVAQAQLAQLREAAEDENKNAAEAELAIANAELSRAEKEEGFMKALSDKGAISAERYAVALSEVELAKSRIALAEAKKNNTSTAYGRRTRAQGAAIDAANKLIDYLNALRVADCFVVAPAKGTVKSILVREGDYVSTTAGAEVARFIVSPNQ